jgi:hypothetical protein
VLEKLHTRRHSFGMIALHNVNTDLDTVQIEAIDRRTMTRLLLTFDGCDMRRMVEAITRGTERLAVAHELAAITCRSIVAWGIKEAKKGAPKP